VAALPGRSAQVKLSGAGVATTGEATTDVGGLHTTYQITNTAHQVLDPQAAVTVKKNGAAQSASLYTLDRLFGRVTFLSALLGSDTVTIDATYLPMAVVAACHDFDYSITSTNADATTFDSAGWTERVPVLGDVQGTLDRFWQADELFMAAINGLSGVAMLELRENSANAGARIWCLFSKSEVKASPSSLIDEAVAFEGAADANGRAVSTP